jgi:choice-of-anchor A domain-containing protein
MSSYGVSVGLPSDGARLDLVAGGNLNVSNARANGSVRYGETLTGSITVPSGGSVSRGSPPFSFADEISLMQLLSFTWGSLAATGTATPSGEVLALSGTSSGLNVFAVTAEELEKARSITIAVPAGNTQLYGTSGLTTGKAAARYCTRRCRPACCRRRSR